MRFPVLFDEPFTEATGTISGVPYTWDLAIDGFGFMVDWLHVQFIGQKEGSYIASSVQLQRTQADTSNEPGEHTLSPDGPWRRALDSFHAGSGQEFFDRPDSNRDRFHTSKGVNCWTKYSLSLLNDTTSVHASTNTNLELASTGTVLYCADGAGVQHSTDGGVTWAAMTGGPAGQVTSLATDGAAVYAAFGASGLYSGTSSLASYVTGTVNLVGYANGRLICAAGPSLYNPTAGGALPTALYTHDNPAWSWVGVADGPKFIYAAGNAGSVSAIYQIGIAADGSTLSVPTVAGVLEPGEVLTGVVNWQGNIIALLATGARFAIPDSGGALTFGPLIPTTSPVLCGTTWNRFAYLGLTNYDTTSTGLMRLDSVTFTDTLTPAYASDLMATGQGAVTSVCFHNGVCYFAVAGVGVFKDAGVPVGSGTLDSGKITFDLPDPKNALNVDLLHAPLAGAVAVTLAADSGTPASLGSSQLAGSVAPAYTMSAGQTPGRWFNLGLTLTAGSGVSPVLHRATLHAWPAPGRALVLNLPLLFAETVKLNNGEAASFDCAAAEAKMWSLLQSGRYVPMQVATTIMPMTVTDVQFMRRKPTTDGTGFQGTMIAALMGQ